MEVEMSNININTGEIRLTINDDESRVIVFNPNSLEFMDNLCELIADLENKEKEYKAREVELDKNKEVNSYGMPVNLKEKLELLKETCGYMREKIDTVFGEGTSQKVFGNANTLDMFEQFFEGVTPYIEKVRGAKINKYTKNNKKNVMR